MGQGRGTRRGFEDALGLDLAAEKHRWLSVGNSGNDAAAFAWFPNSVGVANVVEHLDRLPTRPAYVTVGERGRGFAELANALLVHHDRGVIR
ncbi:MAG: hypothetical protein ACE5FP_01185 [Gemmatimonadota bacterium]